MASWMIHFRVAEALLESDLWSADPDRALAIAYVMGNVAPDSGVPTPDGRGYLPNKDTSHVMRRFDSGLRDRCDTHGFAAAWLTPEGGSEGAPDPEAAAFYLGYLSHLATDNAWLQHVVLPAKERFAHLRLAEGRETPDAVARFYAFLKKDWYDMDFLYIKKHPDLPAYRLFCTAPPFENRYLPFFPADAFEARRAEITAFYARGARAVEERETYLSEAELTAFVHETAAAIRSEFGHLFAACLPCPETV